MHAGIELDVGGPTWNDDNQAFLRPPEASPGSGGTQRIPQSRIKASALHHAPFRADFRFRN